MKAFDVIVIGGGHAGIEASRASALMGCTTALITMSVRTIGVLSCNPSIGGSAKGHLVKEIDAIGGIMPLIADRSGIQFKMLNTSKVLLFGHLDHRMISISILDMLNNC